MYVKTYRIACLNYVQFIVHHFYLIKLPEKKYKEAFGFADQELMSRLLGAVSSEKWGLTAVNNGPKRKKEKGALFSGHFTAICQKTVLINSRYVVTLCLVILVCAV